MRSPALLFIALTSLALHAQASSPDAWAAYDKAVLASCTQASQLSHAKPVGKAAQFDDRVGYSALLLEGQYPQSCASTTSRARPPTSPNGIQCARPPRANDWRTTCFAAGPGAVFLSSLTLSDCDPSHEHIVFLRRLRQMLQ